MEPKLTKSESLAKARAAAKANREAKALLSVKPTGSTDKPVEALPKFPRTETEREEMTTTRAKRQSRDGLRLNFKVYGTIPGYHLHGIVDDGGDLQAAIQDGYEFVKPGEVGFSSRGGDVKEAGDRISTYGGRTEGDKPYQVYLMKIKQEIYDELTAERSAQDNEEMNQISKGNAKPFEGQYKPSMATSIERK